MHHALIIWNICMILELETAGPLPILTENLSILFTPRVYSLNVNAAQGRRSVASSRWLIIPAPSFIESETLKGFLLAHPSFLIVLIFHWSYRALHFQKDAASFLFSLSLSSTAQPPPPPHTFILIQSLIAGRTINANMHLLLSSYQRRQSGRGIDLSVRGTVNKASRSRVCWAIMKCKK